MDHHRIGSGSGSGSGSEPISASHPFKTLKPKPRLHPLALPAFSFASCFVAETSDTETDDTISCWPHHHPPPPATCRPSTRPKAIFGGRRRNMSADFRYDATSYALNFDDGGAVAEASAEAVDDQSAASLENRFLDFSARLPSSPPRRLDGV